MAASVKDHKKQKGKKSAFESAAETVDLTKQSGDQQVEEVPCPECALFDDIDDVPPPQPHVSQGTIVPKKKKGGRNDRVGIDWTNFDDRINVRAKILLRALLRGDTSNDVFNEQMDFATKLARFEVIHNELEAEKMDMMGKYMSEKPHTAPWILDPRTQLSWSMREGVWGEGVSLGGGWTKDFTKITKLSDCMKYMNIEAHPHLLAKWYFGGLPAQAAALGVKVVESPQLCHRVVGLSRTVPPELVGGKGVLKLSDRRQNSMRYLFVSPASEACPAPRARSLASHLHARRPLLPGQLTLLLLDCENYLSTGNEKTNVDLTMAGLLVRSEIDTIIVRSSEELVKTILQFTRAVAEEPAKLSKRALDDEASFYMRGDNKNCVAVDAEGNGLSRLWQQMLSVLPQSSLETARAIAGTPEYSTPRQLAESVRTEEGARRLREARVGRSAAPGARARRLGPARAAALRTIFTSRDGDTVVD